jgi:hypothetical protein
VALGPALGEAAGTSLGIRLGTTGILHWAMLGTSQGVTQDTAGTLD